MRNRWEKIQKTLWKLIFIEVQKKAIVAKGFWSKLSYGEELFIYLILPMGLIYSLFNPENQTNGRLIFVFIFLIPCFFALHIFYKLNDLRCIGTFEEMEKEKLIQSLQNNFKLKVEQRTDNFIILHRSSGLFSWGKRITLIFHQKEIWINQVTLGRHNLRSPFHYFYNRRKIDSYRNFR